MNITFNKTYSEAYNGCVKENQDYLNWDMLITTEYIIGNSTYVYNIA